MVSKGGPEISLFNSDISGFLICIPPKISKRQMLHAELVTNLPELQAKQAERHTNLSER